MTTPIDRPLASPVRPARDPTVDNDERLEAKAESLPSSEEKPSGPARKPVSGGIRRSARKNTAAADQQKAATLAAPADDAAPKKPASPFGSPVQNPQWAELTQFMGGEQKEDLKKPLPANWRTAGKNDLERRDLIDRAFAQARTPEARQEALDALADLYVEDGESQTLHALRNRIRMSAEIALDDAERVPDPTARREKQLEALRDLAALELRTNREEVNLDDLPERAYQDELARPGSTQASARKAYLDTARLVREARTQAATTERSTARSSATALQDFLHAKTPEERKEALARLRDGARTEAKAGTEFGPRAMPEGDDDPTGMRRHEAGDLKGAIDFAQTAVDVDLLRKGVTAEEALPILERLARSPHKDLLAPSLDADKALDTLREGTAAEKKALLAQLRRQPDPIRAMDGYQQLSAEELLKSFPDPGLVEEAKQKAKDDQGANLKAAEAAFDKYVDAEGPADRKTALDELKKLHRDRVGELYRDDFRPAVEWAEATTVLEGLEKALAGKEGKAADPAAVAAELEKLGKLAEAGNPEARRMLEGVDVDGVLADLKNDVGQQKRAQLGEKAGRVVSALAPKPVRGIVATKTADLVEATGPQASALATLRGKLPKLDDELADRKVRRHIRRMTPGAKPAEWEKALAGLRAEKTKGNEVAASWIPWAEAHTELAKLADPAHAKDALAELKKQADAGNPFAKGAFSQILLNGASPSALAAYYEKQADVVEGKPTFIPQLDKSIATEARRTAADEVVKRFASDDAKKAMTRADAAALSAGYAAAVESKDAALAGKLEETLRKTVALGNGEALHALGDAARGMGPDTPGASEIGAVLLAGAKQPAFAEVAGPLLAEAPLGNPAARRLAVGLVGREASAGLSREAKEALVTAAKAGDDAVVQKELLAEAKLLTGKGDVGGLYEALGRSVKPGTMPEPVRHALTSALEANRSGEEMASAARGLLANAKVLTATDLEALATHPRAETLDVIRQGKESLSETQQQQLAEGFRGHLTRKTASVTEKQSALRALSVLGESLKKSDVDLLNSFRDDAALREDAGHALLALAAKSRDYEARGPATQKLLNPVWPGITPDHLKKLVDIAKGNPRDLDLEGDILNLAYDAGMPRSVAGMFKDLGVPGDNARLALLADQAVRKTMARAPQSLTSTDAKRAWAADEVRSILSKTAMVNGLPTSLREELFADLPAAGRPASPDTIDPRQVAMQLARGTLGESGNRFLLGDVRGAVEKKKGGQEAAKSTALHEQRAALADRRRRTERLAELTKEGIGFGDRLAYLFGSSRIDDYAGEQGRLLRQIRTAEGRAKEAEGKSGKADAKAQLWELGDVSYRHAKQRAGGDTRGADLLLLDTWKRFGDGLSTLQPDLMRSLTQTGPNARDWGAWQRMHHHGLVADAKMPDFQAGTAGGFAHANRYLRETSRSRVEGAEATRAHALRAIDADPAIQGLTKATQKLTDELPVLQSMFAAGQEGTKYEDFVRDAKRRGANVSAALQEAERHLPAAKAALTELKKTRDALPWGEARRALDERIDGLEAMVKLTAPGSKERNALDSMLEVVRSGEYEADTFGNWLKRDGPIMAAAIAGAVGAVVLFGPAGVGVGALLVSAMIGGGGALVGGEVMKEGLYHLRNATGAELGKGESLMGKYFRGGTVLDADGNKVPMEFLRDVGAPYLQQWGKDSLITFATMGLGRVFGKALSGLGDKAGSFLAKNSATLRSLSSRMGLVSRATAGNPARETMAKRFMSEFADELLDEGKEKLTEEALTQVLGKSNAYAGMLSSLLLATKSNVSFSRAKGSSVIDLGSDVDLGAVAKQLATDGNTVATDRLGNLQVTTYDGQHFTLRGADPAAKRNAHDATQALMLLQGPKHKQPPSADDAHASAAHQLTSEVVGAFQNGDTEAALAAAQNTAKGNPPDVTVEIKTGEKQTLPLAALSNPGQLNNLLDAYRKAATSDYDAGGKKGTVTLPELEVDLGGGKKMSVKDALASADLTPTQRAALNRVLGEQALVTLEERLHVAQRANGNQVMSKTFADVKEGDAAGHDPKTRSRESLEQELMGLLYDAGMPVGLLDQHYGFAYKSRKPTIEALKSRETSSEKNDKAGAVEYAKEASKLEDITAALTAAEGPEVTAAAKEAYARVMKDTSDVSLQDMLAFRAAAKALGKDVEADLQKQIGQKLGAVAKAGSAAEVEAAAEVLADVDADLARSFFADLKTRIADPHGRFSNRNLAKEQSAAVEQELKALTSAVDKAQASVKDHPSSKVKDAAASATKALAERKTTLEAFQEAWQGFRNPPTNGMRPPPTVLPWFPNAVEHGDGGPVQGGGGRRRQWYDAETNQLLVWDSQHGDVEVHEGAKPHKHVGSISPFTGAKKPGKDERKYKGTGI